MARSRLGFRGRQIAAMTAVAAFVALVTSGLSAALLVRSNVSQIRDDASLIGRTLYHQIGFVVREHWGDDVGAALASDVGLRRIADSVVGYSPVTVYVAVLDERQRVVFHSNPDGQGEIAAAESSLVEFAGRNALVQGWMLATRSGVLALDLPFSVDGERRFGTIRVAVSTVLLRERLSGLVARSAGFSGGIVLLAFGVSFFVADRTLAPIERLRAELTGVDVGGKPLDLRTEADASRIAALFSSMARELDRRQSGGDHGRFGAVDLEDGVAVLSADGHVLLMSATAARMTGSTDRPASMAAAPLRELARSAIRQDGSVGPELLDLSEFLGDRKCLARAWPLRIDGEPVAVVLIRDSERLSSLAAELAHARRLGTVGRIGTGVTHEVKNVLNAIVTHAELLRRRATDDRSVSSSVDILDKELHRLGNIVETFLQFARPSDMTLEPIELKPVIDDAVALVSGRLQSQSIDLELDLPSMSPVITGDAEMLRQALINLMVNACDAMTEGGTLRVVLTSDPQTGGARIRVEDTGAGIPRDELPRIFDLYHSTKPDGSGIGLSTVYQIVHMHGGQIEVESEPGSGSRFTVQLPGGSN